VGLGGEESGVAEESASTEESPTNCKGVGKEALAGWYFGLGGGYSSRKTKVDFLRKGFERGRGFSAADIVRFINGGYAKEGETKVYKAVSQDGVKDTKDSFAGSVNLGWGRFVCNGLYLGLEAGFDISKTDEESKRVPIDRVEWSAKVKSNGFVPRLNLRLGYYLSSVEGLIYMKLGGERLKVDVTGQDKWSGSNVKMSKITPSIGVGFEKAVNKKVSVKLEGEYAFRTNKTGDLDQYTRNDIVFKVQQKIKTERCGVRVLANYHI
jgi:hypothetical protein